MDDRNKKPVVVAVSGGFDPIHIGHIEMFERARALGDKLVVILNNDNWLKKKRGHAFMSEDERMKVMKVIKAIRFVDDVVLTKHPPNPEDMSVSRELRELAPDIFGPGGDRKIDVVPEVRVCEEIGCRQVYNLGEKIQSSSWLLANYLKAADQPKPEEREV